MPLEDVATWLDFINLVETSVLALLFVLIYYK